MRITIINQFYKPDISPTAQLAAALAEDRALRGDEVTVITSRGGYVESAELADSTDGNPRIDRVWTPRLGKANLVRRAIDYASFYALAAERMLCLPRQDVIISLTTPPFIAGTALLHKALHRKTKLVLWNMDCYPDQMERLGLFREKGLISRAMRWFNRRIYAATDHLICLDKAMADLLSQYHPGKKAVPTSIIPNFEKADFFRSDVKYPDWDGVQRLGITGKFKILYLGNAGPGHEFETVLEAARKLADAPVAFLFVGGGKRWPELEQLRDHLGLTNVFLHGYVQKEMTRSVLAASDCALITQSNSMLGVQSPSKLHANLAAGLPIIYVGPAGGNVDEAIRQYGCGVSLAPGSVDALVEFVRRVMHAPAEFTDMRRRARHAFDSSYSDKQTMPQFDRVLRSVTEGEMCLSAPPLSSPCDGAPDIRLA